MNTFGDGFRRGIGYGFTIFLIIVFCFFFLFTTYMDKKIVDLQREHFYNLIEINASHSDIEISYLESRIASADYKRAMATTFIVFLLILISWRIDHLEKR